MDHICCTTKVILINNDLVMIVLAITTIITIATITTAPTIITIIYIKSVQTFAYIHNIFILLQH